MYRTDDDDDVLRLVRYAWLGPALRGGAALCFGAVALSLPMLTANVLLLAFVAFMVIHGAADLVQSGRRARHGSRWAALLGRGLLCLAAGAATVVGPQSIEIVLVACMGAWAMMTGLLEGAVAYRLRHLAYGAWLLGVAAPLSLVFGARVLLHPSGDIRGIAWVSGAYALLYGGLQLVVALWIRTLFQPPSRA
jgi:uncharacterized membrane protein HdeD (DUF308 family)